MCDMISDSILDAYFEKDANSRVACEVTATTGVISVMGEITSNATVDISRIVRETVREIGYEREDFGFNAQNCAIISMIDKQSEDIDLGVSFSLEARKKNEQADCNEYKESLGAGDQGMMFGFACNETVVFMPAPIYYANLLSQQLSKVRKKNKLLDYLGPDGKSMITFEYNNGKPTRIDTIIISTQHLSKIEQEKIHQDVIKYVINPIIPNTIWIVKRKFLLIPLEGLYKGVLVPIQDLQGERLLWILMAVWEGMAGGEPFLVKIQQR